MALAIARIGPHLFSNSPYFTREPIFSQKAFEYYDGWLRTFAITELGRRRGRAECESTNDDESFTRFVASFFARVAESFKDTRGRKERAHDMSEHRDVVTRPA